MTNTHVSDVFITVAPPLIQRGWFIAIGYQIPFEGGLRWQQLMTEIRPLADTRPGALPGFPNAVSPEFNRHTFSWVRAQNSLFCALTENLVPPGLERGPFAC